MMMLVSSILPISADSPDIIIHILSEMLTYTLGMACTFISHSQGVVAKTGVFV